MKIKGAGSSDLYSEKLKLFLRNHCNYCYVVIIQNRNGNRKYCSRKCERLYREREGVLDKGKAYWVDRRVGLFRHRESYCWGIHVWIKSHVKG
jgi:hypothetical protein